MNSAAVDNFVREARAYCRFVEEASASTLAERIWHARERLLALYSAALSLPPVEPDDLDPSPTPEVPIDWPGFGDKDLYWEVFDPYEERDLVAGSLEDDVLDVYRDIRAGLTMWDGSQRQHALWEWRSGSEGHWGDHAVDALRALHRACRE